MTSQKLALIQVHNISGHSSESCMYRNVYFQDLEQVQLSEAGKTMILPER